MIKTAICDDEPKTRAYLSSLIQAQPFPCEITEYASAGVIRCVGLELKLT